MIASSSYVEGLGWLAPFAALEDVPAGPRSEPARPDLSLLDRSLRRGLSDVTRSFMHVAKHALEDAQLAVGSVATIFASAFGEIGVAEALLAQAYDHDTSSPARFRNSVHNTAPGLFSISAKNTLPATAISAGCATTAMALLEAGMQLVSERERVLLVWAEEPMPSAFAAEHQYGPLAVALVLARKPSPIARARLSNLRMTTHGDSDAFGPERHPLWPALLLARALTLSDASRVALGSDEASYVIDVEPLERR
jgi:hypothetical protein